MPSPTNDTADDKELSRLADQTSQETLDQEDPQPKPKRKRSRRKKAAEKKEETTADAPETEEPQGGTETQVSPTGKAAVELSAKNKKEKDSEEKTEDAPEKEIKPKKEVKETPVPEIPEKSGDPVYSKISAKVCRDNSAITADRAKKMLGWTTPPVNEDGQVDGKFDRENTHFKDREGTTIFCSATKDHQRPWYPSTLDALMWDILKGQWQLNGEPASIGAYGAVMNGKHRLGAVVLAQQEFDRNPDRYPAFKEAGQVSVPLFLITGIEESQAVVQTIDTGRPRSLTDTIFSAGMFDDLPKSKLRTVAKALDHATRLLWDRTRAVDDAYSPVVSHTDAIDFIQRHPTLLEVVRSVVDADNGKEKLISRWITPGYMSGLMYLMSVSDSEADTYREASPRDESLLTLSARDKAEEFLVSIAAGDNALKPMFKTVEDWLENGGASPQGRIALIVKAWNQWDQKGRVTPSVAPKFETDDLGYSRLVETPTVGGIDLGPSK